MPLFRTIRYLGLALLAAVVTIESSSAQGPTVVTGGGFVPGGQVLYASNFAQDPIGNFPSGLKYVRGPLEVVQVNGIPMLRSTGPAEFIIPLSAPLPQDFTLEFDLVARNSNCCSGEELAFEGSPQLNRSVGSAWVAWHHQYSGIIGGGQDLGTSTVRFPEDLQNELLGQLGQIQVQVSGTRFRLFTNGRQIYDVPDPVFRRTTVLRIFLGGVDDATGAVYLARVRLAAGGGVAVNPPAAPGALAGIPAPAPGPPPGVAAPAPPAPTSANPGELPRPGVPPRGGPVTTTASSARNAARCVPGSAAGPEPQKFMATGIRVGGAQLQWNSEPNTEFLVDRAPAPSVPPAGGVIWTRLASTCDAGASIVSGQYLDEDMVTYQTLSLVDIYPGVQLGAPYQYRLTRIQAGGTSGSRIIYWEAPFGSFKASPVATVSGNTVTITTGVSYCAPLGLRCDPWMLEFTVTGSSSGFSYSRQQAWHDNSDPLGEPGTVAFAIPGVPPGTHTFSVTALYQPDFKVTAGSVTVTVP